MGDSGYNSRIHEETFIKTENSCLPYSKVVELSSHMTTSALSRMFGLSNEKIIRDFLDPEKNNKSGDQGYFQTWSVNLIHAWNYWIPVITFWILFLLVVAYAIRELFKAYRKCTTRTIQKKKKDY